MICCRDHQWKQGQYHISSDVALVDEIQWSAEFDILLFLRPESYPTVSINSISLDFNIPIAYGMPRDRDIIMATLLNEPCLI